MANKVLFRTKLDLSALVAYMKNVWLF